MEKLCWRTFLVIMGCFVLCIPTAFVPMALQGPLGLTDEQLDWVPKAMIFFIFLAFPFANMSRQSEESRPKHMTQQRYERWRGWSPPKA